MRPNINVFEIQLKDSQKWETLIRPRLTEMMITRAIESIDFETDPDVQRSGIDIILKQEKVSADLKVRSYWTHRFRDILLETDVGGKPGWFYTTKANLIFYVWKNEHETNLVDGYIIHMTPELREWFEKNKQNFSLKVSKSRSDETGREWLTENRAVPIDEFPKGSIFRFNPYLDLSEQKKLGEFFEGS